VGWLYVIDGLLIGLYIVSFFYPRRMVKKLSVRRDFAIFSSADPNEEPIPLELPVAKWSDTPAPLKFNEGEQLRVSLELENNSHATKYFLEVWERFTPASVLTRRQKFFVTYLKGGDAVRLDYTVLCDKRGLYQLPGPFVESAAPFGLFRRRQTLIYAQAVLVYPEYYELAQFPLRRPENVTFTAEARVGPGTDIYGTREYRQGDSLRHIHWPSSARVQHLIVKEFEQVISSPITIMLDLQSSSLAGVGKQTTLEYSVKLAASVAYYATRAGHPVYLLGHSKTLTFPRTALAWNELLELLAQVAADGETPLAEVVDEVPPSATLFAPVPCPDATLLERLLELRRRRMLVTTVLFDFASFGAYLSPEQEELAAELAAKPLKFGLLGPLLLPKSYGGITSSEANPVAQAKLSLDELETWEKRLQREGVVTTRCKQDSNLEIVLASLTSRTAR
jgi:uncharacterized protein (DUF58 family)